MLLGAVVFAILAYTVSGVNRFVIGFIVSSKLIFMVTTVMAKSGDMELAFVLLIPLIVGTVCGLILMSWTKVKISAFVLATAFIGASEVAPVIAKYINQGLFAYSRDFGYLLDPIDIIFSLMKVELTDKTTLLVMIPLLIFGITKQFKAVKAQLNALGYNDPLSVPLITFETENKKNHGKVIT
jgi:hypothetical protein